MMEVTGLKISLASASGLLVSNEGNYRNVQVEGLSKGLTLRTLVRKITKIFRLGRL